MLREDAKKLQLTSVVDNRPLTSDVYHLILKLLDWRQRANRASS